MSWPKRLPEAVYAAAIAEAEAYLREHLPKEGDRSMTWTMAFARFYLTELAAAEAQKASLEPKMSRLEIREELFRNLIAHAKGGDELADTDLRMLAIDFLDAAIKRGNDMAAPRSLLGYVRDVLVDSLPRDTNRLRARQIAIADAVDLMMQKLPDIRPTRNQARRDPEHPESACSLVAKALANVGHTMSEENVQKAWESCSIWRELICSRNS